MVCVVGMLFNAKGAKTQRECVSVNLGTFFGTDKPEWGRCVKLTKLALGIAAASPDALIGDIANSPTPTGVYGLSGERPNLTNKLNS